MKCILWCQVEHIKFSTSQEKSYVKSDLYTWVVSYCRSLQDPNPRNFLHSHIGGIGKLSQNYSTTGAQKN